MKIVVTGTRGIPAILGGVETHCEELFPRIAAKGYDVVVIRRGNYVNDQLKEFKGVHLVNIGCPRKKSFEAIIHTWKAIWKASSLKADIVHIHAIGPALLTPVARMLGLKVVFTHHGPDYDRDKWGSTAKFMLKLGERMGCIFANEVIVISKVIGNIINDKYKRENYHLIYNGVPAANFIDSVSYLEELGVESRKYIFAMGRFVPEKNFHHLIEAFAALKDPSYKLILAGDADFEDEYSIKLKDLALKEKVILTGFIKGEKLHTLLSHARLFVLPSSHEGLPISLLEAMSYKLPVLVSNIPANLEIGLSEGSYFQVGDREALEIGLSKHIDDNFKEVDYNMNSYNWDNIAKEVIGVYER